MKYYKAYYPMAAVIMFAASSCSEKTSFELDTYTVEPTSLSELVTATGTMESVTSVDVGTQVTGIISNLFVDFNDQVKKGQLIAEIDKTVLQSELQSADATLASARATYEYTKKNYERDKALHAEKLISDYEYQTTQKDYEVARMAYEKSQADRVRAANTLTSAEITSPIDGIVVSREVEEGQTVVSNMNVASLYVIADLDHMQVVGDVDEADIGQVKVGQHVTFTVDSYPDDTFTGTVTQVRINPTTTNNVVTYEVIVSTTNPDHKLIPGMTANLSI
ncbi:MAG: efflux RND transporter periplasmic adaptor subunit, partial [Muribaculaceae bacterium]|nr:efflux RND transporter periplasmic adaptor subunit [Muribaculaceae bacterium]